jgi:formylglycine-generating enzyme required for sulfatase activity
MKRILGIAMVLGLVGCKADVIDLGKGVKLEMILIPSGKFMMGSSVYNKARNANEAVLHGKV